MGNKNESINLLNNKKIYGKNIDFKNFTLELNKAVNDLKKTDSVNSKKMDNKEYIKKLLDSYANMVNWIGKVNTLGKKENLIIQNLIFTNNNLNSIFYDFSKKKNWNINGNITVNKRNYYFEGVGHTNDNDNKKIILKGEIVDLKLVGKMYYIPISGPIKSFNLKLNGNKIEISIFNKNLVFLNKCVGIMSLSKVFFTMYKLNKKIFVINGLEINKNMVYYWENLENKYVQKIEKINNKEFNSEIEYINRNDVLKNSDLLFKNDLNYISITYLNN